MLCEACGRTWERGAECPTCGHVTPLVVCAWCPDTYLVTRMAVASGHDVTHGMCLNCAKEFWA